MKEDKLIENAYIDNFFFVFFFDEGDTPSYENKNDIILDDIQEKALSSILEGNNVFIAGKAGTGKTKLIEYYIEHNKHKRNIVTLAPTGIAAENANGKTMHSFFRLPLKISKIKGYPFNVYPELKTEQEKEINDTDVIIIDEISMVRCDTLDFIDTTLRHYRKSEEPFGGIQIIIVGDLGQLPPVNKSKDWKKLKKIYKTEFFFSAKVWEKSHFEILELQKNHRQKDEEYIAILNKIRVGDVSIEELNYLNKRYEPNFHTDVYSKVITLTSRIKKAKEKNEDYYNKLSSKEYTYEGTSDNWEDEEEEKEENIYPVDIELKLKVGSRVMFTRNTNDFKNGTMGRVIALDDNYICVEKDDGEKIDVEKATWEKVDYYIDDTNQLKKHVKGTFTQYPLKLAWAISIHKSQGLTLDEVAIDAEKCFAAGQVYVALSRCKTLNGIHLLSPITKESIKVDKNVKQFMQSYGKE